MKLSIVLSTQPASFSALAYKGHWEENIGKIKALGYDGVELAVRDPRLLDVLLLKALVEEHCLVVPAIGTGQAYGEEGLSFTHPEESIRTRAIERVQSHIELARGLNAVVIIGLIRGKSTSGTHAGHARQWLIQALRICAATDPSVRIAVEPINRYETDLINTVDSGLALVEEVHLDNVGLLLDTFHMNIEEPSMIKSIRLAGDRLFHFHVADSNRWYPGAGHTDFERIIEALAGVGYRGFVSAEILPEPDPDTAARRTIERMRQLCH